MVLVIGLGGTGSGATWVWTGNHWQRPRAGDLPGAWFYSPMWSDPVTGALTVVDCCSAPPAPLGAVDSTWSWDGSRWVRLTTTTAAPLDGSTMALDPTLDRLVLCTCGYSLPAEPKLARWTGTDWVTVAGAALPFTGGIEVTDADRGQLLLLGSPKTEAASSSIPVEVWTLTGATWRRIG
jgi:hypothetical protein